MGPRRPKRLLLPAPPRATRKHCNVNGSGAHRSQFKSNVGDRSSRGVSQLREHMAVLAIWTGWCCALWPPNRPPARPDPRRGGEHRGVQSRSKGTFQRNSRNDETPNPSPLPLSIEAEPVSLSVAILAGAEALPTVWNVNARGKDHMGVEAFQRRTLESHLPNIRMTDLALGATTK